LIPPQAQSRVYYEVADLQDVGGKTVAVIGAGDAAFDYALQLSRRGGRALIFNRSTEIRSLPLLVSRAEASGQIEYHPNTALTGVEADGEGLRLQMVDGSAEKTYKVDMLLGALGRTACLPAFSDRLAVEQLRLSPAGQFHLIGDIHNGIYRQTAIAAGDGLRAAMIIYQYLKEQVA
jgi:thioredoxin reductase